MKQRLLQVGLIFLLCGLSISSKVEAGIFTYMQASDAADQARAAQNKSQETNAKVEALEKQVKAQDKKIDDMNKKLDAILNALATKPEQPKKAGKR